MATQQTLIYTTADHIDILTRPGAKLESAYDFRVSYRQPGLRVRTPKHIHLIVDLFQKRIAEPRLTNALANHIIERIIKRVPAATSYPPSLRVFRPSQISRFEGLYGIGEYSPEFLLVVIELIMIQEKTNYPNGTLNLKLFQAFRDGRDIFSVVSAATFRGR